MVIQNADRSYEVIRCLDGTDKTQEYLCTGPSQGRSNLFLLVRIADQVVAKRFMLFLDERVADSSFTDYQESFLEKGDFYVVFSCDDNPSLAEKLSRERCVKEERIQITLGILEKLLLLMPHPYFAWNVLVSDRITVDAGLTAGFRYRLDRAENPESVTMKAVCRGFAEVLKLLFDRELANHLYPLLEDYAERMEKGVFASYLEMYQNFMDILPQLRADENELKPQSFWFRLWERIKKLLGALRKVLMIALLIAAAIYMLHAVQDESGSQVTQKSIDQIGDLTIE